MAFEPIRNVVVVGGGGNLGPSIIQALESEGPFNISILSRQGSNSTFPPHIKVHKVADSYPEGELMKVFEGQDAVVSAVGAAIPLTQMPLIDAAVKAGVKRFIPAEYGMDKHNPKVLEALSMFGGKAQVLEHLKMQESSGMTWTGIITGSFLDWGIKNGFLGFDIANRKAKIYDSGEVLFSATTLPTIGLAVARSLLKPAATANKDLYIRSLSMTQNDILAALKKATEGSGKEWTVQHVSMAEEIEKGMTRFKNGDRSGVYPLILGTVYREGFGGDLEQSRGCEGNRLLRLPIDDLDELVKRVVGESQ